MKRMGESGSLIPDQDYQLITQKLNDLATRPLEKFERNLKAVGYLAYLFQKIGLQPIVVGGHAVELYTTGHYTTVDVDLVMSGYEKAKEVLERVGFHKEAGLRHWYHEGLGLALEIPDDILAGSMDKIIEIATEPGYYINVIGIEDLILDRLRAAVYWNSLSDREWALLMIHAQRQEIDFDYLLKEAEKEEKVFSAVKDLIGQK